MTDEYPQDAVSRLLREAEQKRNNKTEFTIQEISLIRHIIQRYKSSNSEHKQLLNDIVDKLDNLQEQ